MKTTSAIIIGAGIGGIAAAVHLAQQGIHVTVVEKNQRPGGRCDRITREGHHFDTGPTLFVMPKVYEAEFESMGAHIHDMLDLLRVDPTYHLAFDDGTQLVLTSDLKSMQDQLEAIEPGSFDGFLRYLEEGRRHYEIGMKELVEKDFRTVTDFFNFGNLGLLFDLKPLVQHYDNMASYFKTDRLKQAFTFQDVYMGLSPFEAPATYSMMPYSELAHGVWYPKGGMYRVVEALVDIALKAGVEFIYETSVERIDLNGTTATGVLLEHNQTLEADLIVANADLPYVYQNLLPPDDHAEDLEDKEFSCSVISFFWGVDKIYPQLRPHTLFLVDDYRENFESIEDDLTLPANPSLYVHAPTRIDPSMAPEGHDTLVAVVPVGHLDDSGKQDWSAIRDRGREAVLNRLERLGITDLTDHLKFEMNYVPQSWLQRYNLVKGATHGLSHTLTQMGYLRPHNRHPHYHNLYFVGASTHPGTGVPTALISGRLVAERVKDDLGLLASS